jgi:tetratricopeptide (TPR) repeat protein
VYAVIGVVVVGLAGVAFIMYRRMARMQAMLEQLESKRPQGTAQTQAASKPVPDEPVPSPLSRLAGIETPRDKALDSATARPKARSFDPGLVTKVEQGELPGLEQLESALSADPKNVELLEMLAYLYYCSKNLDRAVDTYTRALRENPQNEVNHYYLANACYLRKDPQQAIRHWGQVEKVNPTSRYVARAKERIDKVTQAGWVSVE